MVAALQLPLAGARLLHAYPGAAVPADVQERAELAVAATHDDDVFPTHVDGPERARPFDFGATQSGEPVRLEDSFLLLPEERRIGVGGAGQRGDETGWQFGADGHGTPFKRRTWRARGSKASPGVRGLT